jgi:hypothetical protein
VGENGHLGDSSMSLRTARRINSVTGTSRRWASNLSQASNGGSN